MRASWDSNFNSDISSEHHIIHAEGGKCDLYFAIDKLSRLDKEGYIPGGFGGLDHGFDVGSY